MQRKAARRRFRAYRPVDETRVDRASPCRFSYRSTRSLSGLCERSGAVLVGRVHLSLAQHQDYKLTLADALVRGRAFNHTKTSTRRP